MEIVVCPGYEPEEWWYFSSEDILYVSAEGAKLLNEEA